jgi:hypothetical protein
LSGDDVDVKKRELHTLLEDMGQRYSEVLGISIDKSDDREIFKWFLAAALFGAPIMEASVMKTYRCFEKHGVLTPTKIVEAGWDKLVKILDEGSYTRYDYKTADKLLLVTGNLIAKYDGSLNKLHRKAADSADLEKRLKDLGKGIGDVTVSIFLRELRNLWSKADPKPTPLVIFAAKNLEIIRDESPEQALAELKEYWKKNVVKGESFVNFETALLRWGKGRRRKNQSQRR